MSSLSPLFADRTFNFPNTFGTRKTNTSTNPNPKDKSLGSHLKPTLPGASVSLANAWEHLGPICFAAARTRFPTSSEHVVALFCKQPQKKWIACVTSCIKKPQKWIACVCAPPCIKSRQHPKHFPTSPLGQYYMGSLLLNFGGQKRSGAFRRIWPSAAVGKLLGS